MGELRKVEAMIDADLLDDMTGAIAAGEYASPADVIKAALAAWRFNREVDRDRLRALVDPALASIPVEGGFDADEVKRNGRARMAARSA